jgi:hypothetical protein
MLVQGNISTRLRAALVALFTLASASVSSAAHADFGTIWIEELKGGWFIGGSAGRGTLLFHGRSYPLSIGGLSVADATRRVEFAPQEPRPAMQCCR